MTRFNRHLQWSGYSLITGLLAGFGATAFLVVLNIATQYRTSHPLIIWGLPIAGLIIGWMYHRYGKDIDRGNNLILDEIHNPKNTISLRMAPMIFGSTILTHLFGGSAGREGTAVQVGASLADQLSKIFPIPKEERKILLVSGAGAGFGAAIGTPIAGIFLGMEVIRIGRLKPFALFECTIASFTAFWITRVFHAPHSIFPRYEGSPTNLKIMLMIAVMSLVFSLLSRGFISATHALEELLHRWIRHAFLKPMIGGIGLVLLFQFFPLTRYEGLGIETVQEAFQHPMALSVPLLKLALTALTLASGFKGGEFVPLVFIGATAGSAISGLFPTSTTAEVTQIFASVGFAAIFGAASNTPFSCSVMAIELFGWRIAPYAMLGCFLSYLASGNLSIYRSQVRDERRT